MQEVFCENTTHYNLRNNNEFIQPTILHKNYETASPFPSVNVVSRDSGVTGCQFSGETLPTITTLTDGAREMTVARKTMVFLQ